MFGSLIQSTDNMAFKFIQGGISGNHCGCDADFPPPTTVTHDSVIICEHKFYWRPQHKHFYDGSDGSSELMWCWSDRPPSDLGESLSSQPGTGTRVESQQERFG